MSSATNILTRVSSYFSSYKPYEKEIADLKQKAAKLSKSYTALRKSMTLPKETRSFFSAKKESIEDLTNRVELNLNTLVEKQEALLKEHNELLKSFYPLCNKIVSNIDTLSDEITSCDKHKKFINSSFLKKTDKENLLETRKEKSDLLKDIKKRFNDFQRDWTKIRNNLHLQSKQFYKVAYPLHHRRFVDLHKKSIEFYTKSSSQETCLERAIGFVGNAATGAIKKAARFAYKHPIATTALTLGSAVSSTALLAQNGLLEEGLKTASDQLSLAAEQLNTLSPILLTATKTYLTPTVTNIALGITGFFGAAAPVLALKDYCQAPKIKKPNLQLAPSTLPSNDTSSSNVASNKTPPAPIQKAQPNPQVQGQNPEKSGSKSKSTHGSDKKEATPFSSPLSTNNVEVEDADGSESESDSESELESTHGSDKKEAAPSASPLSTNNVEVEDADESGSESDSESELESAHGSDKKEAAPSPSLLSTNNNGRTFEQLNASNLQQFLHSDSSPTLSCCNCSSVALATLGATTTLAGIAALDPEFFPSIAVPAAASALAAGALVATNVAVGTLAAGTVVAAFGLAKVLEAVYDDNN